MHDRLALASRWYTVTNTYPYAATLCYLLTPTLVAYDVQLPNFRIPYKFHFVIMTLLVVIVVGGGMLCSLMLCLVIPLLRIRYTDHLEMFIRLAGLLVP